MQNSLNFTLPIRQNRHIMMAIGFGALVLIWLSIEDGTVLIVSLLGVGLSIILALLSVLRWLGGKTLAPHQWISGMIFLGTAIGFGAVWCTVGLMIFKNAWHSHAAPDFASVVVVGIIERLFFWILAGGLLGGAAALIRLARHSEFKAEITSANSSL